MTAATGLLLAPQGELTVLTAGERTAEFLAALGAPAVGDGGVDLDLSAVTECDTAGLQVLLVLRREADQAGRPLRLLPPPEPVAAALRIARLGSDLNPIGAALAAAAEGAPR